MASKAATKSAIAVSPQAHQRLYRIYQIIGDPKRGIEPLIPVSRSGWHAGVREGKFPAGIKLSPKITVWRESDVLALISSAGA